MTALRDWDESFGWRSLAQMGRPLASIVGIATGASGFFLLGLLDDRSSRRGLPAWSKLALQIVVASVVVALGVRFDGSSRVDVPNDIPYEAATTATYGDWPAIRFAVGSPAWTVIWLVAVVNLVNFMDGIDAIVSTSAAVVLLGACGARWGAVGRWPATVDVEHAAVAIATAGGLLGFLVWNAPRAKIFLGDGGSHLVGFVIASLPCLVRANGSAAHAVPWPLVAAPLLPSVVDVGEALIHKARHGIPMSQAHNDHLYQRLVKAGWSHGAVAIRYGVLALIGVVLAGPVAMRTGWIAACGIGAVVMAIHLWTGARTTRSVPRLAKGTA
jgi:UDP-N-acetylmuramyl pentapeptide phosphotransferase/UDP-N-acetylglucosamine-1-phosphate transferase